MIDPKTLLTDLKRLLDVLRKDLRSRADEDSKLDAHLRGEYEKARKAGRTAAAFAAWRDEPLEQAAVAWILGAVFVRFLEDNGLLDEKGEPRRFLAGTSKELRELAEAHYLAHIRANHAHADDAFLLSVFEEVGRLPGGAFLFDERHNPLFQVPLSPDGAKALRGFFRAQDAGGGLVHEFTDSGWSTRFLGDLYQDLSQEAKKRYALLQTPEFVEEFILDRTLTPAIDEFGWENVRLIDPACGSGHFLLGAFARLADLRRANEPGLPTAESARRALEQVFGVDLNPFAVAIARFRLLVAALSVAGLTRLAQAPVFRINVAAGDSLLHGRHPGRETADSQKSLYPELALHHHYETEDAEDCARILGGKYEAVVANPPYITVKDAGLNDLYRQRFATCKGKYSLVCPFMERLVDLCARSSPERPSAGYIGAIASNAFMKREFGSKLVEEFLPKHDLTHVIDTSGAYIPGHGTPTVILLLRGRKPEQSTVRAVMGIRGEPSTPDDAAKGLVWTAIVGQVDAPGSQSDFVSVADVERERLARHPWSMGGGGAAELKEAIEEAAVGSLSGVTDSIGITSFTLEDDLYLLPREAAQRQRIGTGRVRPMIIGDSIRDWQEHEIDVAVFPYSSDFRPLLDLASSEARYLWVGRTSIANNKMFGGLTKVQAGLQWFEFGRLTADKLRTPLSITFAFVATHNHFVLDRGGKVFNRSAPVIKLPPTATEDDHLGLLGLLNSSTACFWMKQVFHNKGATSDKGVLQADPEKFRFEFDGTKLSEFPIPQLSAEQRATLVRLASRLDEAGRSFATEGSAKRLVEAALTSESDPRGVIANSMAGRAALRAQMVRWQEELDWLCYEIYGLLAHDSPSRSLAWLPDLKALPPMAPDERPYRSLASGRSKSSAEIDRIRLEQTQSDERLALIERPEFKRRWFRSAGAYDDTNLTDDMLFERALRDWLCDRLERPDLWPEEDGAPALQTTTRLSDRVRRDPQFRFAAELYLSRPDVPFEDLVKDLCLEEGVPYLAALRYTDEGLRKRLLWEETWTLQRREDAGEDVGTIPVPPKYDSKDFRKSTYWRHRGKLDVPKERFVLHPGAEREADPAPVVGWAGWDHLQRGRALAAYYVRLKEELGAAGTARLVPLLAGLQELVPWLIQWHDEVDPELGEGMGTYIRKYVASEAHALGVTVESLPAWRPEPSSRGAKRKAR